MRPYSPRAPWGIFVVGAVFGLLAFALPPYLFLFHSFPFILSLLGAPFWGTLGLGIILQFNVARVLSMVLLATALIFNGVLIFFAIEADSALVPWMFLAINLFLWMSHSLRRPDVRAAFTGEDDGEEPTDEPEEAYAPPSPSAAIFRHRAGENP